MARSKMAKMSSWVFLGLIGVRIGVRNALVPTPPNADTPAITVQHTVMRPFQRLNELGIPATYSIQILCLFHHHEPRRAASA
jgi:hypothetical protein